MNSARGGRDVTNSKPYELHYILDTGRMVSFAFSPHVDFDKYNKTILQMYGKHIVKRYVLVVDTQEVISLRQLRTRIDTEKTV